MSGCLLLSHAFFFLLACLLTHICTKWGGGEKEVVDKIPIAVFFMF